MFPILARLGPVILYTYTFLVDLGLVLSLVWLYRCAPPGKGGLWLNAGLAAAAGGLAGARLFYVAAHSAYYLVHLDEALAVWNGGLSWPGAALGALAGLWVYCSSRLEPILPVLDALALPIGLMALASWGGCLAAGCAYGYEVSPGQLPAWLTASQPDLYGLTVPRWPAQALGLAWSLLALGLVWGLRRRGWPSGAHGLYALSLTALGAFFLSFTRGDPAPLLAGFRLDTVGAALVLVSASLAWAWRAARPSRTAGA